ncbi:MULTISPECIES: bifunctional 2-polyprenyl-6-hydroxyphenol methylase/3-demethylubiquinol 3-O-methyltransferase UbiG [unclassified Anabaena]|uniref:class I SAM-dependent methyltransferase n=1 Tax=unclassified Anabaena TaxID=2619674 RepID=UPI00082F317C|nr:MULTISPECIES: class I SAM-dependent methyltransferase [unclassified Anabaena]
MNDNSNKIIYERIKKIYYSLVKYDYDQPIILKFIRKYSQPATCQVLDVGCGYGKKMRAIATAGYQVLGVDVNPTLVEANQKQGLNCITLDEFSQTTDKFDIILMSHIIEHFHPSDLKDFLDDYLDRLKSGGYLIIATPLLTEYFYEDFDHVKPYLPIGILMVFGRVATQVQYYSRNKLALKDVQFRRRHFRFTLVRAQVIRTWATKFYQVLEFICVLLYFMSFGWFGRKDGWVGIFQKI